MARTSFTLRKYPTTSASTGGSTLQNIVAVDDDSALRGDNFVSEPSSAAGLRESFFSVKCIDYGVMDIEWGIGSGLVSAATTSTPEATEIQIRWDTIGEPQTVSNGQLVTKITSEKESGSTTQQDLPDGTWIYYSLFVKYEGVGIRSWYEKVSSLYELTPNRYGSTELLWRRIARHWRLQDGVDSGPVPTSSELYGYGPLYRALDVLGWDMDRMRTLIHFQMVAKDPQLATPENLDQMAVELGIDMKTMDLGTERLRNILNDIGYLRQSKGTLAGVREWLTAIAGSDVEIRPTPSNLLTTAQSTFTGTITNTTNPAAFPLASTNQWIIESVGATATAASGGGLNISRSGTGYEMVVAKCRINNVNQGSWYKVFYDVTNQSGASVLGAYFSPTVAGASAGSIDYTGFGTVPEGGVTAISDGTNNWYQSPIDLKLSGDGTFTTQTMYLHIYMVFGPTTSSLKLNNVTLLNDDRYPYTIDVFTQRANLVRDPQFTRVDSTQWSTSASIPTAAQEALVRAPALSDAVLFLDSYQSQVTGGSLSNLGTGGSALNARFGSTTGVDGNDPAVIPHTGTNYLYLPGVSGNYVSIPDTNVLDISGDLEIEVIFQTPPDWTVVGNNGAFVGKEETGQRSFCFRYGTGVKRLALAMTKDGSTASVPTSSVDVPTDTNAIKVTVDIDNGAGGYTTTFYTSNNRGVTYSQLGTTSVGTGTFPIFAGTAALNIGQTSVSGAAVEASYRRVIVRNGIGGPAVVDIDFTTGITNGGQNSLPATIGSSALDKTNSAYLSNLGTSGVLLNARRGSLPDTDSNDPEWLVHTGINYLYFPGTASNSVQIPHSSAMNIPGDHEIIACISADSWASGTQRYIFMKGPGELTANYSLQLNVNDDLTWAGLTSAGVQYSTMAGFKPKTLVGAGKHLWVKMTRENSTGTHRWYYSTGTQASVPGTWASTNTEVVAVGATLVPEQSSPLYFPFPGGVAGKYYRLIVKNGINGTPVVDIDYTTGIKDGAQSSVPVTVGSSAADKANGAYVSNLGSGGVVLDARRGAIPNTDSNDPAWLVHTGTNYLYLPGTQSNNANTPTSASLSFVDNIEFVARLSAANWIPSSERLIISKQFSPGGTYFSLTTGGINLGYTTAASTSVLSFAGSVWNRSSFSPNTILWVKVTRDATTGSVSFYWANDQTTEPSSWNLIGTSAGVAGQLSTNGTDLSVGGNSTSGNWEGNFYRAIARHAGNTVFDVDFTTAITSGNQTSLTATTGQTVTISRSTTGRKSVAVTKSCWLLGTDDYFEVQDDPRLDPPVGGGFTALTFSRPWTTLTTAIVMGKRLTAAGSPRSDGWTVAFAGANERTQLVDDNVTVFDPNSSGIAGTYGTAMLNGFVINGPTLTRYINNTSASTNPSGLAVANFATQGYPLRIGRFSDNNNAYFDGELFGAAVWRRALSAAEVSSVNDYYTGTSTAASVLLQEAVFWIDAEKSQQAAGIVRASTGRKPVAVTRSCWLLGTDDYFEVPDDPSLNFNATESLTTFAVVRQWGTPVSFGRYVDKKNGGAQGVGYSLSTAGSVGLAGFFSGDGTNQSAPTGTSSQYFSYGSLTTLAGVINRSTQTANVYTNASVSSSSNITSLGSLANSYPLKIGVANPTGGSNQDFELFGVAIWRRALSAAEISSLNDYYNGTSTAASTIFADAVFWIDPNQSQQAAAIVRTTSGRKSVAVTRPTMLFGLDDYLEVPDSPLLNFGATDSFTVLWAGRQWPTSINFGRFLDKMSAANVGWRVFNNGTTIGRGLLDVADGTVTTGTGIFAPAFTAGNMATFTAVRNVAGDYITHYVNGVWVGGNQTDLTTGSLSNTVPLRIGISATGSNRADFEFFGAAVWRRSLTATEIAQIYDYYNSVYSYSTGAVSSTTGRGTQSLYTTTGASTATVTISTTNSTPVRIGIPYFFSVDDLYNNISTVSLVSDTYGTLCTGVLYRTSTYSDGSTRKTWQLLRDYAAPWLPLSVTDVHVKLTGYVGSGKRVEIRKPLLEFNYSGGDYFDGDNTNGGWLSGTTTGTGVADYRWGAAGKSDSFSYYSSDYQRTVATLYRLLDTIIPVTQTGAPEAILKLNCIYGYTGATLL